MKSPLPIVLMLFTLSLAPHEALAIENSKNLTEKIAIFLKIPIHRIFLECSSKEIDFPVLDGQKTMRMCLRKTDRKKRCEISIHNLTIAPEPQKISFEALIENSAPAPKKWFSIMQIHSFPDKGEKWRCPPFSLEYFENTLRLFNRWDTKKTSKTFGDNCTEEGSSIASKTVFSDIPLEKWIKISLDLKLSFGEDGYINTSIGKQGFTKLIGPNIYNDKRLPFLKFGIYKPTSWDKQHKMSCVTYRNIDISGLSE